LAELEIRNLHVKAEDKEILKGLDLDVEKGKVHALMGPNGSGKSTLANVIMGHPAPTPTSARRPASSWPSSTPSRSRASRSPSTCG
jgi:Fe-S cluster assembly ATPase SufC